MFQSGGTHKFRITDHVALYFSFFINFPPKQTATPIFDALQLASLKNIHCQFIDCSWTNSRQFWQHYRYNNNNLYESNGGASYSSNFKKEMIQIK